MKMDTIISNQNETVWNRFNIIIIRLDWSNFTELKVSGILNQTFPNELLCKRGKHLNFYIGDSLNCYTTTKEVKSIHSCYGLCTFE